MNQEIQQKYSPVAKVLKAFFVIVLILVLFSVGVGPALPAGTAVFGAGILFFMVFPLAVIIIGVDSFLKNKKEEQVGNLNKIDEGRVVAIAGTKSGLIFNSKVLSIYLVLWGGSVLVMASITMALGNSFLSKNIGSLALLMFGGMFFPGLYDVAVVQGGVQKRMDGWIMITLAIIAFLIYFSN